MNRFFPLLLSVFLLCGCAAQNPQSLATEPSLSAQSREAAFAGYYDAESELEMQTAGAVRVYPLPEKAATGFLTLGDSLLLFEDTSSGTQLTVLSGETLLPVQTLTLDFPLTPQETVITPSTGSICFFHKSSRQMVLLSPALQTLRSLDVPGDLVGAPVFSEAANTLYYCTDTAVRALDLSSGISRVLKEIRYPAQSITGLLLEDTVLQVTTTDHTGQQQSLFLSTQTGQQLAQDSLSLDTHGTAFYGQRAGNTLLYGDAAGSLRLFHPKEGESSCFFLPASGNAVTVSHPVGGQTVLDCYDLAAGMRRASLALNQTLQPIHIDAASDGHIWVLAQSGEYGCTALYRWDTGKSSVEDLTCYTGEYYTRQNPDYEGLAECSLYAQEIGARHGVEVLIYKDAAALQPWDYDLTYEYAVPALKKELALLDARLSHYPQGLLETLAGTFSGIKICIVAQITGSPESGSVEHANGIQFWEGYDAYIVLAAGQETDRALYHELCHLLDTVVLTRSTAYDQWDKQNPAGFRYANRYDHSLKAADWLQAGWDTFLDDYSLSYPKEDRARIMEYAMTPGHADLFQSPYLQAKLRLLCTGIREAFRLEDSPQTFLWEQYLQIPLAAKE